MEKNQDLLTIALELQAISRNGLTYTKDVFDKERFEKVSKLAAELIEMQTGIELDTIIKIFDEQKGYQTPKVETRGVIIKDNKILLVKEKNKWALPGGWMDYNQSVSSNTIKELEEETGLSVRTGRILAIQNRNLHNCPITIFEVIKIFVECEVLGGEFKENNETTEIHYFLKHEIEDLDLDIDKTTAEQIDMCFDVCAKEENYVVYD